MSLYVPYYRLYNKHNTNIHAPGGIQTHDPSKRAAEFEPTIPVSERPKTHVSDPTATGIGSIKHYKIRNKKQRYKIIGHCPLIRQDNFIASHFYITTSF
jgi:hypothetical protein